MLVFLVSLATLGCRNRPGDDRRPENPAAARSADRPVARQDDERPSIIVVVLDTLRVDAVSAYGKIEGTTPTLDRLASEGARFENAFSAAPWTVPSHASLFSGLLPTRHRIGINGRFSMNPDVVTIAEQLQSHGYTTAGFSENPLISEGFQFEHGFDHFEASDFNDSPSNFSQLNAVDAFKAWNDNHSGDEPFFVFVNIFDAHAPYARSQPTSEFLPAGVTVDEARAVGQDTDRICNKVPPPNEIRILEALYRQDVKTADDKLRQILEHARKRSGNRKLVTTITSDHGEHFGEHDLTHHQYSVRSELVRVPLIVHGFEASQIIDAPVSLVDIAPSVLQWAGVDVPPNLDGRPLPTNAQARLNENRLIVSTYSNDFPTDWPEDRWIPDVNPNRAKGDCQEQHRVFGHMLSIIEFPYKLNWYEKYPVELYDLSADPAETTDLSKDNLPVFEKLSSPLQRVVEEAAFLPSGQFDIDGVRPELLRNLRGLGYID